MFDLEKEKSRIDEKLSNVSDKEFIESLKRNGYKEIRSSNDFGYELDDYKLFNNKKLGLDSNLSFYKVRKKAKREIA